jgi:hypothetical protein
MILTILNHRKHPENVQLATLRFHEQFHSLITLMLNALFVTRHLVIIKYNQEHFFQANLLIENFAADAMQKNPMRLMKSQELTSQLMVKDICAGSVIIPIYRRQINERIKNQYGK